MSDKKGSPDELGAIDSNGRSKKWVVRIFMFLAIAAGLIYGGMLFVHSLSHESTDNAYVAGTIVPVSPEVRGKVVKVYVEDNQQVDEGSRLVEISPDDYADQAENAHQAISTLMAEQHELETIVAERVKGLAQAEANLNASAAEEDLAQKQMKRYTKLAEEEAASRSQYDTAESRWKVAAAHREAASFAVAEAKSAVEAAKAKLNTQSYKIRQAETAHKLVQLNLQRTIIVAPTAGRVAKKNVDPGKYVQPGQALLSIVKTDSWVVANFKETQVAKMAIGQPVEVRVDAYPGITFRGRIDSLQPGTGAVFSLLPPENATGNFVKVVQRVPVKIVMQSPFDPVHPLWPGLSVVTTVDVSVHTGPKLAARR